jgi:hypothetical protein
MKEILFAPSLVSALFMVLWIIKYPSEIFESLTFRNEEGVKGHLLSVLSWLFFAMANLFVMFISGVL